MLFRNKMVDTKA